MLLLLRFHITIIEVKQLVESGFTSSWDGRNKCDHGRSSFYLLPNKTWHQLTIQLWGLLTAEIRRLDSLKKDRTKWVWKTFHWRLQWKLSRCSSMLDFKRRLCRRILPVIPVADLPKAKKVDWFLEVPSWNSHPIIRTVILCPLLKLNFGDVLR